MANKVENDKSSAPQVRLVGSDDASTYVFKDRNQSEIQISDLYINSYYYHKLTKLVAQRRKAKKRLFSDNFSVIVFNGTEIKLDQTQAAILRYLYENSENKSLNWADFQRDSTDPRIPNSSTFKKYFRSNSRVPLTDLYNAIIVKVGNGYRFNKEFLNP